MNRAEELLFLFRRDLEVLRQELNAFQPEELIWKTTAGISNSSGHLCLHICGNLRHYIGSILGGSSYQRDRQAEFTSPALPRHQLLQLIEQTERELADTLNHLTSDQLDKPFPVEALNRTWITNTFLLHLYGHLHYHLGQINYLRRFLGASPH
jgi:uncharacterized damage-inducible protein DinB